MFLKINKLFIINIYIIIIIINNVSLIIGQQLTEIELDGPNVCKRQEQ